MTSRRQVEANRKNALLSTGPRETSRTRLNGLKHGIFSNQVFIQDWEDRQEFELLRTGLTDTLAPEGYIEQLLVDELISLTWRRRRILVYENAAIRQRADQLIKDWKDETAMRWAGSFPDELDAEPTEHLTRDVERLEIVQYIASLAGRPLDVLPEIWYEAFVVAESRFSVPISPILKLKDEWRNHEGFSREEAELVISAVCEKSKIDEAEFWKAVREEARKQHLRLSAKIEVRSGFVKMRQLAGVLDGDALEKLVRGEGLVTRAFYKALHELQRLQAARLHDAGHPPVALDLQG